MDRSFLSLYRSEGVGDQPDDTPFAGLLPRSEALRVIETDPNFDLLVVGGGLTGVTVARRAALQGMRVLVIEPGYFGDSSISWRTYFQAILSTHPLVLIRRARAVRRTFKELPPHLVSVRSSCASRSSGIIEGVAAWVLRKIWPKCDTYRRGCPIIPDLNERLLVREMALAARQEGAIALTAIELAFVERDADDGSFRVGLRDDLSDFSREISAQALFIDPTFSSPLTSRLGRSLVKLERVPKPIVSVVCSVEPLSGTAKEQRFYGGLVGQGIVGTVNEVANGCVEVNLVAQTSLPSDEKLPDLIKDACKLAGWCIKDWHSLYKSGRTFAQTSRISAKRALLTVEEQGPWNVFKSADGVVACLDYLGASTKGRGRRPLAGEARGDELEEFRIRAHAYGVCESTIKLVLQRWHGRVRYLESAQDGLKEVCPGVLRGEILLALASDQVSSLEDLIFGALCLHYLPNWVESVPAIAKVLEDAGTLPVQAINIERTIASMVALVPHQ